MPITFEYKDVADINMRVAEQCLIQASVEDDSNLKLKSLVLARQSLDNAINSFNINSSSKTAKSSPKSKTNSRKKNHQ